MDWNKIITEVLIALLPVIGTGIVALIGYGLKYLVGLIQKQNNSTVNMLAGIAIHWAEDQVTTDKLNAATQAVIDMAKKKGINVDPDEAKKITAAAYASATGALAPLVQAPSAK